MNNHLNTGFIGCGSISHFHADVLKKLNVNIVAAAYRSNSDKAELFKTKYGPLNIYSDWRLMIESERLDFVWVTASWDVIDDLLLPVMSYNLPVFFEKPVALSSVRISEALQNFPHLNNKIQVGYNRRFYTLVKELKEILKDKKIINIEVFIPESVKESDTKLLKYRTLQNSSHIFDLLFYIISDFDIRFKHIYKCSDSGAITPGFTAMLETSTKYIIYISSIFNSPQNTAIRFYTDDQQIYELKPVEMLSIYKGFDIIDPTPQQPIRLYNPRLVHRSFEQNDGFKPGFLEQAVQFIENTIYGRNENLPNLISSQKITQVIEEIIN
jgi:predicted dehydrogenase